MDDSYRLPALAVVGHAMHCKICLAGLPAGQVDVDPSRLALVFYCLGSLDVLDLLHDRTRSSDRELHREWIWDQQTSGPHGTGFKAGPYMTPEQFKHEYSDSNTPQIIMTYTALMSLSILRDDFSRLDRLGLIKFVRACQNEDGSFSSEPSGGDSDLRTSYCAFAISSMLNDWSGMNVDRAIAYIRSCRTYEGGYGQIPFGEALGGTTYCALSSLYLARRAHFLQEEPLSSSERHQTIRWLLQNQTISGGFSGRTGKIADACYCFWCGVSLEILGAGELVNTAALASFLASCQYKFGGIAKAPDDRPDPYHTYLSLAALSILPPARDIEPPSSWTLQNLEPLLNATVETAAWARAHVPAAMTHSEQ